MTTPELADAAYLSMPKQPVRISIHYDVAFDCRLRRYVSLDPHSRFFFTTFTPCRLTVGDGANLPVEGYGSIAFIAQHTRRILLRTNTMCQRLLPYVLHYIVPNLSTTYSL
jgi:hypothetical protein